LLLVDDGSSDSSGSIAQQYAKADSQRIRYLQHADKANHGVCSTRNLGIAESSGEYIAFLDADDIWLPEKLREQVQLMSAHPEAGLVFGNSRYFEEGADAASESTPQLAPPDRVYQPPELMKLSYPLGPAGAPCPSDMLARYVTIEQIGGFEESFDTKQVYEDQVFLAKVYLNATVFVSSRTWDRYRRHPDSCWTRAQREGVEAALRTDFLHWLEEYLRYKKVADPEIWAALRRLSWPERHPVLAGAKRILRGATRRVLRQGS
jgi:glycosyltransferase involved in cell wall biosynthesis